MDKVASFFKGLFGRKVPEAEAPKDASEQPKESPQPETPPEPSAPVDEATHGMEAAPPAEGTLAEDQPPSSQPLIEEAKKEPEKESATEAPIPEAPAEGAPPSDEKPPEEVKLDQPTATPEQPATVEQPKAGFFDKLFSIFKKPATPAQPHIPSSDAPKEPEKPAEATDAVAPAQAIPETPVGTPDRKPAPIDSIEEIPGMDPSIAEKLKKVGYNNVDELREAVPEDLVLVEGIDMETAKRICAALYVQA